MICGTEWDMRNMMPSLQDGDNAAFLRVLPTRRQRAYKMAALPKRWRRGSFFLYNVDVTHKMVTRQAVLPTRWRRFWEFTHKMAACIQDGGVTQKMTAWEFFRIKCRRYPQDGGVPTNDGITHKTVLCLQDSGVHTRWRRYQQDAYKMATVPRFCEFYPQDGGVHTRWRRYPKDDGVGVFSYKMSTLPTRWRCTYKMVTLPTRWCCAYKMAVCTQDGDVTNKKVALPTRCLQGGDSAVFLRVLPTKWQCAYKMMALPTKWCCAYKMAVYLQNGNVSASFTQRSNSCDNKKII